MRHLKLALGVAALLAAAPVVAHHSFDLTFDRGKSVALTGTVTEFRFVEPHVYFKLAVVGADGSRQEWHVETTSVRMLDQHGWDSGSIEPGEVLAVRGFPARTGGSYMRLLSMSHADGSAVALWLPPGPS